MDQPIPTTKPDLVLINENKRIYKLEDKAAQPEGGVKLKSENYFVNYFFFYRHLEITAASENSLAFLLPCKHKYLYFKNILRNDQ